jgi:hypothetical protein
MHGITPRACDYPAREPLEGEVVRVRRTLPAGAGAATAAIAGSLTKRPAG